MEANGSSGQEENKKGHSRFVARLTTFQHRFDHEGPTRAFNDELCRFLTRWLTNHVEVIDVGNLRAYPEEDATTEETIEDPAPTG